MGTIVFKDALIVNEGQQIEGDLLVKDGRIERIGGSISSAAAQEVVLAGKWLLPGIIDDQVHFREPGLTHKADIASESAAAVAGGVTSFMEMPNTKPAALTQVLLQNKYDIAAKCSPANYSFFMGASNDNLNDVLETDPSTVCGVKIFMGSSTGNMLVDEEEVLDKLFANVPMLIATHCEDEARIRERTAAAVAEFGEDIPFDRHPWIRDEQACLISSSKAVELAKKHDTRLHILHISTSDELALFSNEIALEEKRITSEVCVHHLWFDASAYGKLGSHLKCNPAIKEATHKHKLLEALLDGRLDIVATDHAPHTMEEKAGKYMAAPAGLPLVSHSLQAMMEFYLDQKITIEQLVEKMAHNPAICFQVKDRGFLREGYFADLVVVEQKDYVVDKSNILYKCGWSPFEGMNFRTTINQTWVNGNCVFNASSGIVGSFAGQRLLFAR